MALIKSSAVFLLFLCAGCSESEGIQGVYLLPLVDTAERCEALVTAGCESCCYDSLYLCKGGHGVVFVGDQGFPFTHKLGVEETFVVDLLEPVLKGASFTSTEGGLLDSVGRTWRATRTETGWPYNLPEWPEALAKMCRELGDI